MSAFASRIQGEGTEAPDQLLANPLNYRRHPAAHRRLLEQHEKVLVFAKGDPKSATAELDPAAIPDLPSESDLDSPTESEAST